VTPAVSDLSVADPVAELVARRDFRMLIAGELSDASNGATLEVVDPSTGLPVAVVPDAAGDDVRRAVRAAERGQPGWERLGLRGRLDAIRRFADLLAARAHEIALVDSIDTGNPLRAAERDMRIAAEHLLLWPALAITLAGRAQAGDESTMHFTSHHPYGVVGRITAFNHPALFAINGALLPLLAGNSVVIKPSPQTPLSTLLLGELFVDAFPPGVVNLVSGGAVAGDALVVHPAIKRIAFIGSVAVGLRIQERAAQSGTVKHVSLELGGKNAMVVFPDVDVDEAVEAAMRGMSLEISQGQSCQATSRILVHRDVHDAFVDRAARRLAQYRIDRAYLPDTDLGPLVSELQHRRIREWVDVGQAEGATLVHGGEPPVGAPPGGYYLQPALFADVTARMRIASEEIFGPVISVLSWEDYDAMLAVANGIDLGLSASVWSRDIDLALETARRLQAGYVWVNDANRHYLGTPFGGVKNSGVGREESIEELLSYFEQKVTHVRLRDGRDALRRVTTG
jgi:acyl-CoA reductase-like NAD-dependent aldehyde dehydrogenase